MDSMCSRSQNHLGNSRAEGTYSKPSISIRLRGYMLKLTLGGLHWQLLQRPYLAQESEEELQVQIYRHRYDYQLASLMNGFGAAASDRSQAPKGCSEGYRSS